MIKTFRSVSSGGIARQAVIFGSTLAAFGQLLLLVANKERPPARCERALELRSPTLLTSQAPYLLKAVMAVASSSRTSKTV